MAKQPETKPSKKKFRKIHAWILAGIAAVIIVLGVIWLQFGGMMRAQLSMALYLDTKYGKLFVVETPESQPYFTVDKVYTAKAHPIDDKSLELDVTVTYKREKEGYGYEKLGEFEDYYPNAVWRKAELPEAEIYIDTVYTGVKPSKVDVALGLGWAENKKIEGSIPSFDEASSKYSGAYYGLY